MRKEIEQLTKDLGFEASEYIFDWSGFKVYNPDFAEETDEVVFTGKPIFILENEKEVRYGTPQENEEIYDYWIKNFCDEE